MNIIHPLFIRISLVLLIAIAAANSRADGEAPRTLKVLTYNAWILEVFGVDTTKTIPERLKLMPDELARTGADVIALQEIWTADARDFLIRELGERHGYLFSAFNGNELMSGNGLLILSKYELDSNTLRLAFTGHTRPDEGFVKKGAIRTRINVPGLGWVDFYNSHLGAITYEVQQKRLHPGQVEAKLQQARELAKFMRETATESAITILAADLNTHYEIRDYTAGTDKNGATIAGQFASAYRVMTDSGSEGLSLIDTFLRLNGAASTPAWTFDTTGNTYAAGGVFSADPCEVIDYVFVSDTPRLVPIRSEVVLNQRVDAALAEALDGAEVPAFLSDHYGVATTFEIPAQPRDF